MYRLNMSNRKDLKTNRSRWTG